MLAPLFLVQGQDQKRHLGHVHVGPAGGDAAVPPQDGNGDGFDVVQVLDPALENLGERSAVKAFHLAHDPPPFHGVRGPAKPVLTDVQFIEKNLHSCWRPSKPIMRRRLL